MLWKLADNVKYEDDCEVSVERSRLQREAKVFLINAGQQFNVQRQKRQVWGVFFLLYANDKDKMKEDFFKKSKPKQPAQPNRGQHLKNAQDLKKKKIESRLQL